MIATLKAASAYKYLSMQSDEKKPGRTSYLFVRNLEYQLSEKEQIIEKMQADYDRLLLFKETLAYVYCIQDQQIKHLRKHYPDLYQKAQWDNEKTKELRTATSMSIFNISLLN